jgi:hypothetical protein
VGSYYGLVATGGGYVMLQGASATLNVWHHLVLTYDGTTACFYDNGGTPSCTTVGYSANTSNPFLIGAAYYTSFAEYFPGSLDDVAVYGRALSATEVQLHYDSGRQ